MSGTSGYGRNQAVTMDPDEVKSLIREMDHLKVLYDSVIEEIANEQLPAEGSPPAARPLVSAILNGMLQTLLESSRKRSGTLGTLSHRLKQNIADTIITGDEVATIFEQVGHTYDDMAFTGSTTGLALQEHGDYQAYGSLRQRLDELAESATPWVKRVNDVRFGIYASGNSLVDADNQIQLGKSEEDRQPALWVAARDLQDRANEQRSDLRFAKSNPWSLDPDELQATVREAEELRQEIVALEDRYEEARNVMNA